jgi:hypothetical protein
MHGRRFGHLMISPEEIADPEKLISASKIASLYAKVAANHPTSTEHHAARAEVEDRFALYAALTTKHANELALEQAKSAEVTAKTHAATALHWTMALVYSTCALVLATAVLALVTAIHH